MKYLVMALSLVGLLSACGTTTNPSESYYTNNETMRSASVNRCRVLDVRQVNINTRTSNSNYSIAETEEQIGVAIGAALGAGIGSQFGGGSGKDLATALGAAIGGSAGKAQGTRMAQKRLTVQGLEYSIINASGREEVIVQHYNAGDRITSPGSTCRVVSTSVGKRVLPAEHLPATIARPKQTTFSN